ncbi:MULTISPECIES: hypothetical protein [unclassified Bradyrhizobium]|uniref:hypothetical protein n=1 Tax=unclassified Bradyrhizobium TaxID=2631580 RepID=UPI0028E957B9|nr:MULTISPECIES: hypothetical protein [unclassified Bradyrhizobium]
MLFTALRFAFKTNHLGAGNIARSSKIGDHLGMPRPGAAVAVDLLAPKTNFARDFNPITPVQSLTEKYSCFYFSEIVFVYAHPASIKRGVSRSSQTLGAGCGGRVGLQRDLIMPTNSPMCTVKPRGPGIPVLMPSSRRRLRGRQGQERRSLGRARSKP